MIQLELQFIEKPKRECPKCGGEVVGGVNKVYCSRRCRALASTKRWDQANRDKRNANTRRWLQANPDKARERKRKWLQANPDKAREYKRKWSQANPDKAREASSRWRLTNPNNYREWRKKWILANPGKLKTYDHRRRARKKANGVEPTAEYRNTMVNPLTHQVCHYCGKDCTGNHHWDHHVPLAAGGPEAPWNLVIACPTCNLSKGAKVPTSIFCEEIFKE